MGTSLLISMALLSGHGSKPKRLAIRPFMLPCTLASPVLRFLFLFVARVQLNPLTAAFFPISLFILSFFLACSVSFFLLFSLFSHSLIFLCFLFLHFTLPFLSLVLFFAPAQSPFPSSFSSSSFLIERTGVVEISGLVTMLSHASRIGGSLSQSLREYTEDYRDKRNQEIEELAAKIPTKMIFPMLIFIWPCFFIVAIGPSLLMLADAFGK